MNRTFRFSTICLSFGIYLSFVTPLAKANAYAALEAEQLPQLMMVSMAILLLMSGIFLGCLLKLIRDQNKLKDQFYQLREQHDELLDQSHQLLDRETDILEYNRELEKRLTARTDTVNKVNHELTKTLEQLHQQKHTLNSFNTALAFSEQKIMIIDKHYRVCFASQPFLDFSGLSLLEIQDQPLKRLEKYICLPEMSSTHPLTLNKEGLIDTQLSCLDKQGIKHFLNARIALRWSELKEILHYVVIFDDFADLAHQ